MGYTAKSHSFGLLCRGAGSTQSQITRQNFAHSKHNYAMDPWHIRTWQLALHLHGTSHFTETLRLLGSLRDLQAPTATRPPK